jgi:hypothetical protein
MKQVCSLVYHLLTDGKTAPQIAEVETLLASPEEKDEMQARQNAAAMSALRGMGPAGFIAPPPPRHKAGSRHMPPKAGS